LARTRVFGYSGSLSLKHVTIKKDRTGAWYAGLNIEQDAAKKLDPKEIDTEDTVGLDLGITNFIHDSDGRQISRLDLSNNRDCLERERPVSSNAVRVDWRGMVTVL
jgi:putative transposase